MTFTGKDGKTYEAIFWKRGNYVCPCQNTSWDFGEKLRTTRDEKREGTKYDYTLTTVAVYHVLHKEFEKCPMCGKLMWRSFLAVVSVFEKVDEKHGEKRKTIARKRFGTSIEARLWTREQYRKLTEETP